MLPNRCAAINQNVVDSWFKVIRSLVIHNVATDVSYHNVATMLSTDALETRGVWSRAHIPLGRVHNRELHFFSKKETIYRNVVDQCVTTFRNVVDRCVKIIPSLVIHNVTSDVSYHSVAEQMCAIHHIVVDK